VSFSYIQYEFSTPHLCEKQLLWLNKDVKVYFALKLNSTDAWVYYSGNASHTLEAGKKLVSYGTDETSAQNNYYTTVKDSANKILAILPNVIQAKYARLYIEAGNSVKVYEWICSSRLIANEIIGGELEITDELSDAPIIRVVAKGQDRIKIGNIDGSKYGIVGYDDSSNPIFELSNDLQKIGGFTFNTTALYTEAKTAYDDNEAGIHIGTDGIGIGNNVFTVSDAGHLIATSAYIEGELVAGEIHIPDKTTANSFHVNTDGYAWWGCNEADYVSDPNNADAVIAPSGLARFGNALIGYDDSGTYKGWMVANSVIYPVGTGTLIAGNFATDGKVVLSTSGIGVYNNIDGTQTGLISYDGSGWFGLMGTKAISWEPDGVVTIGGFTADDTTLTATHLLIDAGNQTIELGTGIKLDATAPSLSMGDATGPTTGIGLWQGFSDPYYQWRVGDYTGNQYILWDGTQLIINGGTVTGTDIGSTTADTFTINSDLDDVMSQLILGRVGGVNATFGWDGTNVTLSSQTIADNAILTVDHDGAADKDYAKFTAYGIEGRSYAEVLSDLSGQATSAFSFNNQNLTNLGTGHDAFSDFVANEHINHSTVSISAGTGLTGGGDITVNRTISLSHLGIQSLTDPAADRIMFWDDSETATGWMTVSTGLQIDGTSLKTKDSEIAHDNLSGFVANEHINHTSVTLTAGDGLSGGGDISSSRTFSVNVDDSTIEINTDTLRVKDKGITYAKIQDISATNRLLGRTVGAGIVEEITPVNVLAMLSGQAGATFSFNNQSLTGINDITVSGDITSANYISGLMGAGFGITQDFAEFANISVRGTFRTVVFQKDVVSAIGGNLLVRPADILDLDMTAADSNNYLLMETEDHILLESEDKLMMEEYSMKIKGDETFAVGDILHIKDVYDGGVGNEWLKVSYAEGSDIYGVIRDMAGDYTIDDNPAWTKGVAVVNYGPAGSGGIYMTASETYAPYMDIYTHNGDPWNGVITKVRLGNLAGISDRINGHAVSGYGLYSDNAFLKGGIVATYGSIGAWDITSTSIQTGAFDTSGTMYFGFNGISLSNTFKVTPAGALTSTSGLIANWSITETSLQTGAFDTNGTMYFGTSGISLSDTFKVTSAGVLTSTSGLIAGWTITTDQLSSGTDADFIGLSSDGTNAIWVGDSTFGDAKFSVTAAGVLKAISGTVGGWILGTDTLTGTGITLSSTGDAYLAIGTTPPTAPTTGTGIFINKTGLFGLNANNQRFKVLEDGSGFLGASGTLAWTNAGVVTAGGFTVSATEGLYSGTGATRVQMQAGVGIWTGATAIGDAPFSVTHEGVLTATNANISGAISSSTIDVGSGASSFHVDIDGNIWSGAAAFVNGVFSVSKDGELTATDATIVGDITATTGYFNTVTLGKDGVASGTLTLQLYDGNGDTYIAAGKTDFTNTDSGFILGLDDSDSNLAKLYLGNAACYLDFDGSNLLLNVKANAGTTDGIIYKESKRFLYDFNPAHNGTVQPDGYNLFFGIEAGNTDIGSTATETYHSSFNIGIGYQSLYSNITGYYNIGIGGTSLYSNTTGFDNVAIGRSSLYLNTGGYNNVAIGRETLYSNTTGHYNNAIGYKSLYSNTIGSDNIANGHQALYSNINGNDNIALGYLALYSNIGGDYNLAAGNLTLYSNTTGNYNIALGNTSLWSNTTGEDNVGVGCDALYSNTEGTNNTSTGNYSLRFNQSGEYNVAMGVYSMLSNISGDNNVGIGGYSLYYNKTGYDNAALGYYSGIFLANGTSYNENSTYSIFIGSQTKAKQADGINEIVIGYDVTGNGSNTVTIGNSSITANYLNGNLILTGDLTVAGNNIGPTGDADLIAMASGALTVNGTLAITGTRRTLNSGNYQEYSSSQALTDGDAIGIFEVAIGADEIVGGSIVYRVEVKDGTDLQVYSRIVTFVGVNKSGTVTSNIDSTPLGSGGILTSGTLSHAWSITNGAGKITVKLAANTSLTPTSMTLYYTVLLNSANAITEL
jgi:hypothetical protein